MAANTEYLVRDPADWAGDCWTTTDRREAYEAWCENQDLQVSEFCMDEGYIRVLNEDFADEYVEDCRHAHELQRHNRSFAPCRRTHGATI